MTAPALTFRPRRQKIEARILEGESMADEHEHRTEDEVLDEQQADVVEDLDVPQGEQEDVAGGSSGGEDRLTENVTLNF
jgi:hypothetical protein